MIKKLRRNEVYLGDCMELLSYVPSGSIDAIISDPPFGTTRNKWDSVLPLDELWAQYKRIIKPNGAIVLFAQVPFSITLGASCLDLLRYELIWEKDNATGHLNANRAPLKAHENILVFYKHLPTYNPQMVEGKAHKRGGKDRLSSNYGYFECHEATESSMYYPRSVIYHNTEKFKKGGHPTQKPLGLIEWLVKTYTNPGNLVLDNTMGSGTTCIAAVNTGRKYLGFEKDEAYFTAARQRIEEAKEQKKKGLEEGQLTLPILEEQYTA